MAFKLRSPLHKENPKFGEVPVAASSKGYAGYQSMLKDKLRSTAPKERVGGYGGGNQTTGTFPDPQTGEKRYYDKAHQSYSSKTGLVNKTGSFKDGEYVMNKPKKSKSPYPANQGGTPFYNTEYVDINKMRADANAEQQKKIDLKNNNIVKPVSNADRHKALAEKTGREDIHDISNKVNVKEKVDKLKKKIKNKNKGVNTNNTNNTNNTKPIKSSDSDKGSYKPNMTSAEFFGRDYSKELANSIAPMPKFEKTVTNARSADHNIIGSKPMSKRDRIIRKQNIKTENKRERVGNQIERIKGRQARKGINIAKKDQKRSDEYVNKGYSSIVDAKPNKTSSSSSSGFQDLSKVGASKPTQKKTSPKATTRTPKSNQTVAKPSIRLNTNKQTSTTIDDSKIKKGAKEAKGGGKVSEDTYKSLTGFNKMTSKPGSSGGFRRGVSTSSTSITKPASGPRATTVKVESGPNKREKFIKNAYNNIRN